MADVKTASLPLLFASARLVSLAHPHLSALEALSAAAKGRPGLQAAVNLALALHDHATLDLCGEQAAALLAGLACEAIFAEQAASEADRLARRWRRTG